MTFTRSGVRRFMASPLYSRLSLPLIEHQDPGEVGPGVEDRRVPGIDGEPSLEEHAGRPDSGRAPGLSGIGALEDPVLLGPGVERPGTGRVRGQRDDLDG